MFAYTKLIKLNKKISSLKEGDKPVPINSRVIIRLGSTYARIAELKHAFEFYPLDIALAITTARVINHKDCRVIPQKAMRLSKNLLLDYNQYWYW